MSLSDAPFSYIPGCTVEYKGPTNTKGSRWVAVIKRGRNRGDHYRASVPYQDGPDQAARLAVQCFNDEGITDSPREDKWQLLGAALSLDGGNSYAYPVGPVSLAPSLLAPANARPEAFQ